MSYSSLMNLEERISYLERTAAPRPRRVPTPPPAYDSRRSPRKLGDRTILDMEKDASDLVQFARRNGFLDAKIKYVGDNPVIVLQPRFYIFLNDQGYEIEYPQGGSSFTYKFEDVLNMIKERSLEVADWGNEEVGMELIELTPTYDDVYYLLNGSKSKNSRYSGYLGAKWNRTKDNEFKGDEYVFTVRCTPSALKFMMKGPYLTSEPYGTLTGIVTGSSRDEQLQGLAARLDFIAEKIGAKRSKARKDIAKLMQYPKDFGGYEW